MAAPVPIAQSVSRRLTADEKRKHTRNVKNLQNRPVNDGRRVDLDVFPANVIQPFRALNWNAFLDLQGPVYDHLVREFYASFDFDDVAKTITFAMDNEHHTLPLSLFAIYLGVPQTGRQFYSTGQRLQLLPEFVPKREAIALICKNPTEIGNEVSTIDLKSPHDLRYKILDWNVINKHGNHASVPASAVAHLWCLEYGITVDLAYFVAKRMSGLVTNKTRGLPYAMLLNNLFANLQIPLSHPRQITANPLDALTMKRMKSTSKRVREDDINEEEEEENIYQHGTSGGAGGEGTSGAHEGAHDEEDPFYRLSTSQKLDHIHREQGTMKKLLLKIAQKLGCNGSPPRE